MILKVVNPLHRSNKGDPFYAKAHPLGSQDLQTWLKNLGCTVKLDDKELFGHPKIVP